MKKTLGYGLHNKKSDLINSKLNKEIEKVINPINITFKNVGFMKETKIERVFFINGLK